jgi:DNA repair exonuclease SbcCD ATPase subunit
MVEQKDKEIEALKAAADQKEIDFKAKDEAIATLTKERDDANSQLSTLNSQLSEKDEEIQKLQKQVENLKGEVKELAEKEAPMVDAGAGIPAGNGTGEVYEAKKASRVSRDNMSYEHVREAMAKK